VSISIFNFYSRFAEILPGISGMADANLLRIPKRKAEHPPSRQSIQPLFSWFFLKFIPGFFSALP